MAPNRSAPECLPDYASVSEAKLTIYMQRLFAVADKHKNGFIDVADLEELFHKSGFNFPNPVISRILQAIEISWDGMVPFEEYLHAVKIVQREGQPLDQEQTDHKEMVSFSTETQGPQCLTWMHRRKAKVSAAKRQRAATASKAAQPTELTAYEATHATKAPTQPAPLPQSELVPWDPTMSATVVAEKLEALQQVQQTELKRIPSMKESLSIDPSEELRNIIAQGIMPMLRRSLSTLSAASA